MGHIKFIPLLALISSLPFMSSTPEKASLQSPSCPQNCGGINIPYPFGIGVKSNCSFNQWYTIICDNTSFKTPKPFLHNSNLEVLDISCSANTITVKSPIFSNHPSHGHSRPIRLPKESPFMFSSTRNIFVSVGCNSLALLKESDEFVCGCISYCPSKDHATPDNGTVDNNITAGNEYCHGLKCCQTSAPWPVKSLDVKFRNLSGHGWVEEPTGLWNHAFVVERKWFESDLGPNVSAAIQGLRFVPTVLNWQVRGTCTPHGPAVADGSLGLSCGRNARCLNRSKGSYACRCEHGYAGNPYVECRQDTDECADGDCSCPRGYSSNGGSCRPIVYRYIWLLVLFSTCSGLVVLIGCSWWLRRKCTRRRDRKLKQKYFKLNGGPLLKQQLCSSEDTVEKSKLFTSKELEKATDRYNGNRVLGRGGQGTVYKGMLANGRIVAVKKSTVFDPSKVKQFINEVVILSKINHRNVVKILGCCLETKFPQLVYEFIPNGTLYHYIHDEKEEFPFSWDMRLQIATEVADALSYLHSAASMPIYHRDIKSSNILLDERLRAKVADFGISKSSLSDRTHVTTMVCGTFGYLDPGYFQTNQLTEKSDVYSFGVVLAELLTGLEPILTIKDEEISLAAHFVVSMERHRLLNIVDPRIVEAARKGEIIGVANLAKRCLNLDGKKRPKMKAVAVELEGIKMSRETYMSNKASKMTKAEKPN